MSATATSAALSFPSSADDDAWIAVCPIGAIVPDTGVAAVVGGAQIAIFRLRDGRVFAIANRDPFTGANVLARGLIGDRGGVVKVASPLHKQSFALESGACLDDPAVRVRVFRVRVRRGMIELAAA